MFETFSEQARRVIFVARLEAGQRGADSISVNSLIFGLINVDQGLDMKMILSERLHPSRAVLPSRPKPKSFFSPEVAADLSAQLKELLPRSPSIPHTTEMPLSPECKRALNAAIQLQEEFHRSKVQPIHLLAALLREPSEATLLLRKAGITDENVLQALQSESDAE
jgi:ATP-dependent Clp protease ATP-binding subunit ClpC